MRPCGTRPPGVALPESRNVQESYLSLQYMRDLKNARPPHERRPGIIFVPWICEKSKNSLPVPKRYGDIILPYKS